MMGSIKPYVKMIMDSFKLYDREPNDMVTEADIDAMYKTRHSFTDRLPWVEYLPDSECFLLDDLRSVSAVYDIHPVNAEGIQLDEMARIRDNFKTFISEVFPQHPVDPWVVEFYQSDTLSLSAYAEVIRNYVKVNTSLTEAYLPVIEKHLQDVCKPGGLFFDDTVTGVHWRGAIRSYRMIFYRRYSSAAHIDKAISPVEELKMIRQRVESSLAQSGIKAERVKGKRFYEWLFRWFNPNPAQTNGNVDQLLSQLPYSGDHDLPYGHDFAENLLSTPPRSDAENGCWYFDDMPHRIITVQNLRRQPKIGALCAPKQSGKNVVSVFDRMPEGTVMSMKVVVTPSDVTAEKIAKIEDKARGEGHKIARIKEETSRAQHEIARDNPMFPVELSFFIRGSDLDDLRQNQTDVMAMLQNEGLNPINVSDDPIILDSYLVNLPMNYDYSKERRRRRSRLVFSQHIANLMAVMGRGKGTGHPGTLWFNRGGEPMVFDPLNPKDRAKNAHMMLFGPTGAGKSAQIVGMLLFIMAIYNARVFLVEAGNSFGILRDFLAECGISTNKVVMKGGSGTIIPPYANAYKALAKEEKEQMMGMKQQHSDVVAEVFSQHQSGTLDMEDTEGAFEKDYLGEMEIVARIMVSGGKKELASRMTLGDQQLIREAILNAARICREAGRAMVLTEDVVAQLQAVSQRKDIPVEVATRFFEYAAAAASFTQGLAGQIFNKEGSLWPDVDFTHIDLAEFVKDSKEAELAVSYMSILNNVNDIAERDQNSGRPIIFLTDEAHLITKNPLLAPGVVKIVKMWRKLGAWMWLATQNMQDFPDEAAVMLSLCEWWLCLALEPKEVEEVARFKMLTSTQKDMLASTRKQSGSYTEGVVLSSRMSEIFRAVPPSLTLALALTEQHEKAERAELMAQFGVNEVGAAKLVAARIDKLRGLKS